MGFLPNVVSQPTTRMFHYTYNLCKRVFLYPLSQFLFAFLFIHSPIFRCLLRSLAYIPRFVLPTASVFIIL
jgi:hypothetical protein